MSQGKTIHCAEFAHLYSWIPDTVGEGGAKPNLVVKGSLVDNGGRLARHEPGKES